MNALEIKMMDEQAEEYRRLFNTLCMCDAGLTADWKAPIEVKFATEGFCRRMADAAEFMTGAKSEVSFDAAQDAWILKSVGYRAGPCGDH